MSPDDDTETDTYPIQTRIDRLMTDLVRGRIVDGSDRRCRNEVTKVVVVDWPQLSMSEHPPGMMPHDAAVLTELHHVLGLYAWGSMRVLR